MSTKERTLAVIKPGAFLARYAGPIIADIQARGFNIVDLRMVRFTEAQAKEFYKDHDGRAYFAGLIEHAIMAPSIVMILEGTIARPNVIKGWRDFIGPTDPSLGTASHHLRAKYGFGMPGNALHGSDSAEAFEREAALVFPELAHAKLVREMEASLKDLQSQMAAAPEETKALPDDLVAKESSFVAPSPDLKAVKDLVAALEAKSPEAMATQLVEEAKESSIVPVAPGGSETAGG